MGTERPNDRRPVDDRAATPACAAPFVAMEFDPFGDVQACCASALYPLGNVAEASLRDIWEGPRAQALRAALLRDDMTYGCGVCRHRLGERHGDLPLNYYDNFPLTSLDPEWPFSLQFSLHNTCNLECIMCGADRSSRIRSRRSDLAPLPHVYGDDFFEQIQPFLAHSGAVDFSGGEPFLVPEHHRLWDLIAQLDHQPLCSLTTNGTVWNDRVETVLDAIDHHISVSLDGTTAETFEAVRVGASFDEVQVNVDRFARYTASRGTQLTITWSLVRQNWFQLGTMLRHAEERGIPVKVQTVIEPEFGVQRLPTDELRAVVAAMDAEGRDLLPHLELNRPMWEREVERLHDELDRRADGRRSPYMEPGPDNAAHVARFITDHAAATRPPLPRLRLIRRRPGGVDRSRLEAATAELTAWGGGQPIGRIHLDTDGCVDDLVVDALLPPANPLPTLPVPATLGDVLEAFEAALGGVIWIGDQHVDGPLAHHTLWVGRTVRDKVGLVLRTISFADDAGTTVVVAVERRLLRSPASVPVELGTRRVRTPGEGAPASVRGAAAAG